MRSIHPVRVVQAFALSVVVAGCAHGGVTAPASAASSVSTTSLTSSQVAHEPGAGEVSEADRPYAPREVPALSAWPQRYPGAAAELRDWTSSHPDTARALGNWQRRHPEQMEALVDWSITYPNQSLGAFLFDRTGWDELSAIARGDDDARGFMSWVRRAPTAARELAVYANGLTFLGARTQSSSAAAHGSTLPSARGATLSPK